MKTRRHAQLKGAWEQASMYLPLLLMGGLALVTYWLVQNMPNGTARPAPPPASEPSYRLQGVQSWFYDADGRLNTRVTGTALTQRPQLGGWLMTDAVMTQTRPDGSRVRATGDTLVNDERQRAWVLSGQAHVQSQPIHGPLTDIRSEQLRVLDTPSRVVADQPIRLTQAGKTLEADRMVFDNASGQVKLEGRVKGVLMPPPAQ